MSDEPITEPENADEPIREWCKDALDAGLRLAWMKRNGTPGEPRPWHMPGEFLPLYRGDVEVDLYAVAANVREDGSLLGWGGPMREGKAEAWEWRFDHGWDDCSDDLVEALEDLRGCFDDHSLTFASLGSHAVLPDVPESVVDAFVALLKAAS